MNFYREQVSKLSCVQPEMLLFTPQTLNSAYESNYLNLLIVFLMLPSASKANITS